MSALEAMSKITDPSVFGKVAVLMGGATAEREISLQSGAAVLKALQQRGVDSYELDAVGDVLTALKAGGFERAFIALHGRGGEDGVIQGALETVGLPYTGSGVLGSAIGMDKLRCKQLWQGAGLPTPAFSVINNESDFDALIQKLRLPLIVKPACEGSSIGMTKVSDPAQFNDALQLAMAEDDLVLAERWITGPEYTVAILDGEALPAIRLETPHAFYDYAAKYETDSTQYHCPCGLSVDAEERLQQLALQAFEAVGASGWGRVDVMCDDDGQFWLLEINTVPGMTSHSLVPMAAKAAGLEFDELVWRILETSL